MPDVTRRGFLKGLSALVGAVAVGSNLEVPAAQDEHLLLPDDPDFAAFNTHVHSSGVLSVSEIPVHDHGASMCYASYHGIRLEDFAYRNPFR